MNDKHQAVASDRDVPGPSAGRKTYTAPTLVLFGQVALLTQAQSGCANNDSSTCGVGQTMGPKVSDRRTKQSILRIGTHPLGIGLYLFNYKPEYQPRYGRQRQFGVMADEVEGVLPAAVGMHPDGHKAVYYGMLGISKNAR